MVKHRLHKSSPLVAVSFILTPPRTNELFATVTHEFHPTKVVENCRATSAEHFNAFLGERPVAIGEITDRPLGSVC